MKNFLNDIKNRILIYDGSKGSMLQREGLKGGECPELWNVTHSDIVKGIYSAYKEAGSDVIQTNTFQGSRLALDKYLLGDRTYELNYTAAVTAKEVMGEHGYVAASVGPIGQLMEPSGGLTFQLAYETFKEQVKALIDGGVDIINFETFTDLAEMRAALLAAKDVKNVPVICSLAFEANGKTLMGTDPYIVAVVLKSLGADMIGLNCSFGPEHMIGPAKKMSSVGGIYLSVKPNAGLPEFKNGVSVFKETPENFASRARGFAGMGARLIGGCCGTSPEFIKELKQALGGVGVSNVQAAAGQVITSNVKILNVGENRNLSVGCIKASEDEELKKELCEGKLDYISDKALDLACEGYDAIYINIDGEAGSEGRLAEVVNAAQAYIKEPFILETANPASLYEALRIYRGKAGIVVDEYQPDTMEDLIKAAKKFGGTIIDRSLVQ